MPRSHTRFPRTGARRKTSWVLGPNGNTGTVSGSVTTVIATGLQAVDAGLTIARIRGQLNVQLINAGALEGFEWAFGLGIVSENAAGVGVTAVPAPLTDIGWDGWMVHQIGRCLAPTTVTNAGNPASGPLRQSIMIDSKAMRKFRETDVLVGVFQFVETVTATIVGDFNSRVLVFLP